MYNLKQKYSFRLAHNLKKELLKNNLLLFWDNTANRVIIWLWWYLFYLDILIKENGFHTVGSKNFSHCGMINCKIPFEAPSRVNPMINNIKRIICGLRTITTTTLPIDWIPRTTHKQTINHAANKLNANCHLILPIL